MLETADRMLAAKQNKLFKIIIIVGGLQCQTPSTSETAEASCFAPKRHSNFTCSGHAQHVCDASSTQQHATPILRVVEVSQLALNTARIASSHCFFPSADYKFDRFQLVSAKDGPPHVVFLFSDGRRKSCQNPCITLLALDCIDSCDEVQEALHRNHCYRQLFPASNPVEAANTALYRNLLFFLAVAIIGQVLDAGL